LEWDRLFVQCPSAAVEAVVGIMQEEAAGGPLVETVPGASLVSVWVPSGPGADQVCTRLKLRFINIPNFLTGGEPLKLGREIVRDEDWAETWKDYYHPVRIGRRLVLKPTWEPWPPADEPEAAKPDDIVIELDPGMAFGTGTHPTTQLALCALEDLVRPGARILDVGCGCGVLSLASVRLGAAAAVAIDVDEVAVKVSRENVELAGAEDSITVLQGDVSVVTDGGFDIVVANVNSPVVRAIAPDVFNRLKPGGYYITTSQRNGTAPSRGSPTTLEGRPVGSCWKTKDAWPWDVTARCDRRAAWAPRSL